MRQQSKRSRLPVYDDRYLGDLAPSLVMQTLAKINWTFAEDDTQFLTHSLHPYPAKFIPQIPGTIISCLTKKGNTVLDPFGGSGTTAVEAVRLGRRAISIDANPVAALIGQAKSTRWNRRKLAEIQGLHSRLSVELKGLPSNPQVLMTRFGDFIPTIPNREKWFPDTSCGELALIKSAVGELESKEAKDLALIALSRIVLTVSFQDSETRYKSVERDIPTGKALSSFIAELENIVATSQSMESYVRYGVSRFVTADARDVPSDKLRDYEADLVVTSPPYGNAYDYHLYHRFRLIWLGFDPKSLGKIEIGSHLKHQRECSGFESYLEDMRLALKTIHRALKPGKYAAIVVGSSIYKGQNYDSARELERIALQNGFDSSRVVDRELHNTKRSFGPEARRARTEGILFLRKQLKALQVRLNAPPYKMWPYEESLRLREIQGITCGQILCKEKPTESLEFKVDGSKYDDLRRTVFSHSIEVDGCFVEPSWQAILENGMAANPAARKDPKYATHGLHPYKGKFYPQLAKGLINLVNPKSGSIIFDPFCGSGTTLLEGYLNGLRSYGIDMNPVAAMVARAKTGVLEADPDDLLEASYAVIDLIREGPTKPAKIWTELNHRCEDEINKWFAPPVAAKIDYVLRQIRKSSGGAVRDFLESVLSSIIREVSQQEPSDLRIRYRKEKLHDADVYGLFSGALEQQIERIEKFWGVRGYSPREFYPSKVAMGDNRKQSDLNQLGLQNRTVDLVVTSPPYATALPYIDTDRLSLLAIFGMSSSVRRPIEYNLIGSRELTISDKKMLENRLKGKGALPYEVEHFCYDLLARIQKEEGAGFRKLNMPALLARFFSDMKQVFSNTYCLSRKGASAMVVIGDNTISLNGNKVLIPTTHFICEIAKSVGYVEEERLNISVTTENLVHIANAITENVVLHLRKH